MTPRRTARARTPGRGPAPPLVPAVLAVAAGGALGGLARWGAGEVVPDGAAFPWTTFAVNVVGSGLLALLPALAVVRDRPLVGLALGPGVLGGFTTLSLHAEQARGLLADGRPATGLALLAGTLAACLLAVLLADRAVAAARARAAVDAASRARPGSAR